MTTLGKRGGLVHGWWPKVSPRAGSAFVSTSAPTALPASLSQRQAQLMEQDRCILVTDEDVPIGSASKRECHLIPSGATSPQALPLHRAFSVFLFGGTDYGHRMLIQQRPLHKATFPGLWANACCSHPLVGDGEDMLGAMRRRLREELGLELPLSKIGTDPNPDTNRPDRPSSPTTVSPRWTAVGRLLYAARSPVNVEWGEHELDHVYALEVDETTVLERLAPRTEEVAAVRWVDPVELAADVRDRPADYAPWFKAALEHLILPVWTDLHHRRRRYPQASGSVVVDQWPAITNTQIIHCGELG